MPTVAIIGRPNVGKSSLFNKIVGKRLAITSEFSGTTRDRLFAKARTGEEKVSFNIVDTSGIEDEVKGTSIENDMIAQAKVAMQDCDVILFILDSRGEITSKDYEIIDFLRKNNSKPIIFTISKCDDGMDFTQKAEFFKIGFGEPIAISSNHNVGINELFEKINGELKALNFEAKNEEEAFVEKTLPNISIIGRPNVGKSSLVNAFLSEERMIVSEEVGTTRDSINTMVKWEGKEFNFIDTAGIRRAGKRQNKIEKYSVLRSLQSIEESDVCLFLIDGEESVKSQDLAVVSMILEAKKGIVLVVNKWDTVDKGEDVQKSFLNHLRHKFPFLPWVPVVFVSAVTKRNIVKVFPLIEKVMEERNKRISTGKFNRFIEEMIYKHHPTGTKNVRPKIYYASQVDINPPLFKVFINKKKNFHFSYFRYLENKIRENFGFYGTCIDVDYIEKQVKEKE